MYIHSVLGHNIQLSSCPCTVIKASEEVMASYMQLVTSLQEDAPVMLEDLEAVCSISQMVDTAEYEMPMRPFNEVLRHYVQQLILSPVLTLLDFKTVSKENTQVENKGNRKTSLDSDFPAMLQRFNSTQDSQVNMHVLTLCIYEVVIFCHAHTFHR